MSNQCHYLKLNLFAYLNELPVIMCSEVEFKDGIGICNIISFSTITCITTVLGNEIN